jgi:hypothetical protein
VKTQKVRIAVVVQPDGNWNAVGWRDAGDDEKRDAVLTFLEEVPGEIVVWVEAEVPVPERVETTVQGTVTGEK